MRKETGLARICLRRSLRYLALTASRVAYGGFFRQVVPYMYVDVESGSYYVGGNHAARQVVEKALDDCSLEEWRS